jgi:hypothetical protein
MLTPYVPNFSLLSCIHKITDGDLELKILTERKMNSLTHISRPSWTEKQVFRTFPVSNKILLYAIY